MPRDCSFRTDKLAKRADTPPHCGLRDDAARTWRIAPIEGRGNSLPISGGARAEKGVECTGFPDLACEQGFLSLGGTKHDLGRSF
jgi:hypothetical protein